MPIKSGDKYTNMMTQRVTMSAANTLTFEEINMGISVFDNIGVIISRLEYEPDLTSLRELAANTDHLIMGFVASDQLTGIDMTQRAVMDRMMLSGGQMGTPATGWVFQTPMVHDFSTMIGGGLIVPPRPWFLAMETTGAVAASVCVLRIYFTYLKLSAQDFIELFETRRFMA